MFFDRKPKSSGVTAEIRIKRCYGCGAILQDKNPKLTGYVPAEKLNSEDEVLCERCFKLRHYSSFTKSPAFNVDYVTVLNKAKSEDALAVYVLNAFCLEGSFLEGIGAYLPNKVLIVVNKRDLLPQSYSDEYIRKYVEKKLAKENIQPIDIVLTSASATKTENMDKLFSLMNEYRNKKSVYLFGAYQVGKSSITNCFLLDYNNQTNKMITTSPYPGTTLDVISIPLDENTYLYDTPGIYNPDSLVSFLEPELVKYVLPRSQVRPEMYPSKPSQAFVFSNFAAVKFLKGEKTNFLFYKSNDLTISRCKNDKAEKLLDDNCKNSALDLRSVKVKSSADLVKVTLTALPSQPNVLRIAGLGFVSFTGQDQVIEVLAPKGVKVSLEGNL